MSTIVNARDLVLQAANPRIIPISLPSNVSVGTDQVQGLTPLIYNATLADFSPFKSWNFDTSTDGWTTGGTASLVASSNIVTVTSTGTDPIIESPVGLNMPGKKFDKIRVRLRRTAGDGWDGNVYFTTDQPSTGGTEGANGSGYLPPPAGLTIGTWTVLEWDLSAVPGWTDYNVSTFRIDLGSKATDVFEIDWIAVGRYATGSDELTAAVLATAANSQNLVPPMDNPVWVGGTLVSVNETFKGGALVTKAIRSAGSTVEPTAAQRLVIDRTHTYRTRFWARAASGTNGMLYHALRQYQAGGTTKTNGGYLWYQPGSVQPHTEWREYDILWDGGTFDTTTVSVVPSFLMNYAGTAGYWEIRDYSLTDATDILRSGITLVGRNTSVVGNTITKILGADATWDSDAYSKYGYTGGAVAEAVPCQTDKYLMFGLNSDPLTDNSYTSIDYAFYCRGNGNILEVYESNLARGVVGSYVAGDVLSVMYDGTNIKYLKNGAVLRTVPVTITVPLYFDSSFNDVGAKLSNVRFGPMTSNNWNAVGGTGKPADNASSDITLTGRGVTITGNRAVKNTGVAQWGDSDVYSKDSYTGGAYASMRVAATASVFMFGLNTDPATDAHYTSIDYALYCENGDLYVYENSYQIGRYGSTVAGDILAVVYDGSYVKYLKNGSVLYSRLAPYGQVLFMDTALQSINCALENLQFGPMSSNNYLSVGNRPQDGNNLVLRGTFEEGTSGLWNLPVVGVTGQTFSKAIQTAARDGLENGGGFPVTPGEKLYLEGALDATGLNFSLYFGIAFLNASGGFVTWCTAFGVPAGGTWRFQKGNITVPTGLGITGALPWLQIDNTPNGGANQTITGSGRAAQLRISRFEGGATLGAVAGANLLDPYGNVITDTMIKNNLIDLSWWKRGGSIPWGNNGENTYLYQTGSDSVVAGITGPRGTADVVLYTKELTLASDGNGNMGTQAGGGWDSDYFYLDSTKTYRFVVFVRRISGTAQVYWGTHNVATLNTNTPTADNNNPYFASAGGLATDRWYMLVGYIYPAGSTGNTHDSAGIWDLKTRAKVSSGTNYTFLSSTNYINHRAYQYYSSSNAEQAFGRPMINVVDGTEPALAEFFEYPQYGVNIGGTINNSNAAGIMAVTSLSALKATLGSFTTGGTGARTDINDYGIKVYGDNAGLRGTFGKIGA